MRWAFWRKRERERVAPLPTATWPPPSVAAGGARDESDEDRPPTPAFSGASPQPGSSAAPWDDVPPGLGADGPPLDMTGVRADVGALVQAALDRDTPAADAVVRRLGSRGDDGAGMASIAAMGALGDRLLAAVPQGADPSSVIAQGDALAARAAVPLSAVAPAATPDLVRFVVRFACGVPEHDPALLPLMETSSDDLVRVAAGLLAQTVLDGRGEVDALDRELTDLLPD